MDDLTTKQHHASNDAGDSELERLSDMADVSDIELASGDDSELDDDSGVDGSF